MVYRNYDKQNTTTLLEDMLKVCARVVETQLRVEAPSSPSSEQQLVLPYVKVPLLDQLDKTDTPTVPDNYAGALALAVALGIVEGMGAVVLPAFYQGTEQPARVNGVIAPDMPAAQRNVVDEIADVAGVAWSHLLQTLSAVLARTTSADETVNASLFKAYQTFTTVAGVLGLEVPRCAEHAP